jgi:hypothetical protein
MKNKVYFYFILFYFFALAITTEGVLAEEKKVYIHPSFELCLKLYPRNKEIVNPMVPRISAKSAFNLYREGKAIFFAAGSDKQALIPGAIRINEGNGLFENPPIKLLREHENKIYVIYCH